MMPPALATKSGAHRTPAAREQVGHRLVGELVVGRAGDHRRLQRGHRLVVEDAAQRARREDVDGGEQRLARARPSARRAARRRRACAASMSATSSFAPRRASSRASAQADVRRGPTTATLRPFSDVRAEGALDRGQRSRPRRRARSRGSGRPSRRGRARGPVTCGVPRGDDRHVARRRPDVLGGDVAAAERVDRVGEVEQRRRARARPCGGPSGSMITPLPPPSGRPATADL